VAPVYGAPAGTAPAETVPAPKKEEPKKVDGSARLIIDVPTDAKLFIDDQAMKTASARRTFSTPALQPGQAYYYEVRAEVVRDGKTQSETKKIIVKAGEVVRASFPELGTGDPAKAVASSGR
jgi:uncharacterized protein (TIGR03000 family)